MSLTRRAAFSHALALAAGASAFLNARGSRAATPVSFSGDPFKLGVASGDPTADGFVIWTRLAPEPFEADGGLGDQAVAVKWTLAADAGFKTVVRAGETTAHPERGHSVHIELTGLEPGRPYWYRFEAGGVRSPAGRGKTLPAAGAPLDRFRMAWASCQHFEQGYFTPYRDMVRWDPDLILHLGDYIYESSWGPQIRRHGVLEARTLDEYRAHHAVYKLDPDLQAAHATTSWAFIWDDHEVENDYAAMVAANPAMQADFPARRAAAYQAYFENLPISRRSMLTRGEMRLYQQLIAGDLVQFVLLDTRQYRAPRPCVDPQRWRTGVKACAEIQDPSRTILGPDQEYWLNTTLTRGPTRWTSIVQPTLFGHLFQKTPQGEPGAYQDGWSAYPAARQEILDALVKRGKQDVVIVGGDMHAFIAADVRSDYAKPDSPVIATEFVTSSITTHSYNHDRINRLIAEEPGNHHIKFYDDRVHGWAGAEITPERWTIDMRAASSIWDRNPSFSNYKRYVVAYGKAGVQEG